MLLENFQIKQCVAAHEVMTSVCRLTKVIISHSMADSDVDISEI